MNGERTSRLALWITIPLAIIIALFVGVAASIDTGEDAAESALMGELAPAIVSEDTTGAAYDLDDQRGQFVLVNVFATWCVPCIEEHPELVAFSEANPDVSLVSIAFEDDPDRVAEFFEREGGDWPVLLDSTIALDWAVAQVPESFLVGPNGKVIYHFRGGVTQDELDAVIAASLGS